MEDDTVGGAEGKEGAHDTSSIAAVEGGQEPKRLKLSHGGGQGNGESEASNSSLALDFTPILQQCK